MSSVLKTVDQVRALIESGKSLALAGDEKLLAALPKGNWIGGTIPYFIGDNGGVCSSELIYVTEMPSEVIETSINRYDSTTIDDLYKDGLGFGFSVIIIPATSATHLKFALKAPLFDGFGTKPLVGWISGVHLSELGKLAPKVFDGRTGGLMADGAVVLRAKLAQGKVADVSILNLFEATEGISIEFDDDGFTATNARINGEKCSLAKWMKDKAVDTRFPLVADYMGTMVNVSFQAVNEETGEVSFYAPVFSGISYSLAKPISDYVGDFVRQLPTADTDKIAFSCNCILNYLYSELEGKKTGAITGPITFGEVAYQLLNQTLAYLVVVDAE